jgi:hypothetical protein
MKCYYHPDADAVGICKSCSKGLCRACAIDVGNGITCKGPCEDEVRSLNAMLEKSKAAHPKAAKAFYTNATMFALLGLLFLISGLVGWSHGRTALSAFLVPAGIIFLIWSFLSYKTGRKTGV